MGRRNHPFLVIPREARNVLFLLLLVIPNAASARQAAVLVAEMTLSQFRALLRSQSQRPGQSPEANRPRADEIFFQLLATQGREAAARQSLDRLDGWTQAAQARLAAQSAPALDVEVLRFSEAKAQARLAQFEAERRRAIRQANHSLGRKPAEQIRRRSRRPNRPSGSRSLKKTSCPRPRNFWGRFIRTTCSGASPR